MSHDTPAVAALKSLSPGDRVRYAIDPGRRVGVVLTPLWVSKPYWSMPKVPHVWVCWLPSEALPEDWRDYSAKVNRVHELVRDDTHPPLPWQQTRR